VNAPVLDSSVTLAWVLRHGPSAPVDAVLERVAEIGGFAPALWWVEVRYVLVTAERRGRLVQEDTSAALQAIDALDTLCLEFHATQRGLGREFVQAG